MLNGYPPEYAHMAQDGWMTHGTEWLKMDGVTMLQSY